MRQTIMHYFPKGKYYIGDPCYVIADKNWSPLLESTGYLGLGKKPDNGDELVNWNDGAFSYNFRTCFANGTRDGDGVYSLLANGKLHCGVTLGVDSGLLAVMPVEAIDDMDEALRLGAVVDMSSDFSVCYIDGIFQIGSFLIKT